MLYYTESLLYPIVSFKSQMFHFNQRFDQSIDLKGSLNFHGINKEIPIKIFLSKEDDNFWGICNFTLDLDIFNVEKPSLLPIHFDFGFLYSVTNTLRVGVHFQPTYVGFYWEL